MSDLPNAVLWTRISAAHSPQQILKTGDENKLRFTKFYFWMETLQWHSVWNRVSTSQESKSTLNPNHIISAKSHPMPPSGTRKESSAQLISGACGMRRNFVSSFQVQFLEGRYAVLAASLQWVPYSGNKERALLTGFFLALESSGGGKEKQSRPLLLAACSHTNCFSNQKKQKSIDSGDLLWFILVELF